MNQQALALGGIAIVLVGIGTAYGALTPARASCADRAPRIVAFGDSLVSGFGAAKGEGFVDRLAASTGVPITNLGLTGDSSATGLARLPTVTRVDPDIVIVLLGGNDALQGTPIADTERNLDAILAGIRDAGALPVVVAVLGGFPQDPYAPMYRRLAERYDAPLVPNVLSGVIGNTALMSDAIHPNAAGYARMAERLLPVLERACGAVGT